MTLRNIVLFALAPQLSGGMFQEKCAQHAVDKARGRITPKCFSQLDGFVDGDLDGDIGGVLEFVQRNPKDVAVHDGELINGPFRGMLLYDRIEDRAILRYSVDKGKRKRGPFRGQCVLLDATLDNLVLTMTDTVNFEKCLQSDCTRLTSNLHYISSPETALWVHRTCMTDGLPFLFESTVHSLVTGAGKRLATSSM